MKTQASKQAVAVFRPQSQLASQSKKIKMCGVSDHCLGILLTTPIVGTTLQCQDEPHPKFGLDFEIDDVTYTLRRYEKVYYLHIEVCLESMTHLSRVGLKFERVEKENWVGSFIVLRAWGWNKSSHMWSAAGLAYLSSQKEGASRLAFWLS